ncbi:MAG: rubrerythrin family protein [Desulfobulbaceae bacterium]
MIPMEQTLLDLYARLKRAAERSRVFAMRADKDGRPELARLFLAAAESQSMQAGRFLMQARGSVAATDDNDRELFEQTLREAIAEYETLREEAEENGFQALATGFRHGAAVDEQLVRLREDLAAGAGMREYYVCDFCGYVAPDAPPDNCPVCTAPKKRFHRVGGS